MLHSSDPRWVRSVRIVRVWAPLMVCASGSLAMVAWLAGMVAAMWLDIGCGIGAAAATWISWRWFRI